MRSNKVGFVGDVKASYSVSRPNQPSAREMSNSAARFGHDEVVRALLMSTADVKIRNSEGKTALVLAAEGGHDQTVALLTQAGAGK